MIADTAVRQLTVNLGFALGRNVIAAAMGRQSVVPKDHADRQDPVSGGSADGYADLSENRQFDPRPTVAARCDAR